MPRRSQLRLSKREVDRLSVEGRDRVFWDSVMPGFGVRVYPTGRKIYVAQANSPTGVRRVSLGRHGTVTAGYARKRAAAAIERIARGGDAEGKAPSPTVAALAERYMEAHVAVNCNANTRRLARGTLDNHILPALGEMAVTEVGTAEVDALHYSLRATPRAANAMLKVLSKMFSLAESWGVAAPRGNPCRHVIRYREGERERFLTAPDEYRRVGPCAARVGGGGAQGGACRRRVAAGDADRLPCAARSSRCAGTTSTGRRARSGCATARPGPGWSR